MIIAQDKNGNIDYLNFDFFWANWIKFKSFICADLMNRLGLLNGQNWVLYTS